MRYETQIHFASFSSNYIQRLSIFIDLLEISSIIKTR